MLEFFWWGSVFLLALPVMGALLILGPRVLPEYRDPDAGRLDVLSAALAIFAVLAVIFGLKQAAIEGISAASVAATRSGSSPASLWACRQGHLADPMIDIGLFRIRTFNVALAINFLAIFVAVGYFLFVAQYLQLVAGLARSRRASGRCPRPSPSSSARRPRLDSSGASGPSISSAAAWRWRARARRPHPGRRGRRL